MTGQFSVVIPVHLSSRRVQRKPLADIGGRPLLWHVWHDLLGAGLAEDPVVVTDSTDVATLVQAWSGRAILSQEKHQNGTSRIAEIAPSLPHDRIVNVQCDQVGFDAGCLDDFAAFWLRTEAQLVTPVYRIKSTESTTDPAVVKARVDTDFIATDFGRQWTQPEPVWGHVGVYGYTKGMLRIYRELGPNRRERDERLEQLRFTENNFTFQTFEMVGGPTPVNTVEELERARTTYAVRR